MSADRAALLLERAGGALAEGDWLAARAGFEKALAEHETAEALEGLSWATMWLEDGEAAIAARQSAYRLYRQASDDHAAARMAMWLGMDHEEFRGELAVARGWRQRARRLLEDKPSSPEHGWLPILDCWAALQLGEDPETVKRCAQEAIAAARECGEADVEIVALAMEGLALVGEGDVDHGMKRLDEAAAAVLAGELREEIWATAVFCFLIHACERVRDFGRAAEWCQAMREVAERIRHTGTQGVCRAHYGHVLISCGAWADAEAALGQAQALLEASRPPWVTEAVIRLAELRRRQGQLDEAEGLLRQITWHPEAIRGLAEIAFETDRLAEAEEFIERYLRHVPAGNRLARAAGLELVARIAARSGGKDRAAGAVNELEAVAEAVASTPLRAATCFAKGEVAFASGEPKAARACFEDAADLFHQSGMPFEAASARLALANVLLSLERPDRALNEAAAAQQVFDRLGAAAASRRARGVLVEIDQRADGGTDGPSPAQLTQRQMEVLRLVSQGLSDREIGARLGVSEHTVHRHVANILLRLDAPNRAAAAIQAATKGII